MSDPNTQQKNTDQSPKEENFFIEIVRFALLAALIIIPFRVFVAEPYIVQGASMSPTFETGHYLIINKFSHKISDVERGDVLVFKYPNDEKKFFIKRVIGLPGETVRIQNREVSIKRVGATEFEHINEPYLKNSIQNNIETDVPEGHFFVMGDNRGNSSDSRSWGTLDQTLVKGIPFVRLYPFGEATLDPGGSTGEIEFISN